MRKIQSTLVLSCESSVPPAEAARRGLAIEMGDTLDAKRLLPAVVALATSAHAPFDFPEGSPRAGRLNIAALDVAWRRLSMQCLEDYIVQAARLPRVRKVVMHAAPRYWTADGRLPQAPAKAELLTVGEYACLVDSIRLSTGSTWRRWIVSWPMLPVCDHRTRRPPWPSGAPAWKPSCGSPAAPRRRLWVAQGWGTWGRISGRCSAKRSRPAGLAHPGAGLHQRRKPPLGRHQYLVRGGGFGWVGRETLRRGRRGGRQVRKQAMRMCAITSAGSPAWPVAAGRDWG